MRNAPRTGISRRTFIAATGAAGLSLTMCRLDSKDDRKPGMRELPTFEPTEPVVYSDWSDVYRRRWEWDH